MEQVEGADARDLQQGIAVISRRERTEMLNVTVADANNDIQRTRFAPRAADASGLWLIPMQTRRRSSSRTYIFHYV